MGGIPQKPRLLSIFSKRVANYLRLLFEITQNLVTHLVLCYGRGCYIGKSLCYYAHERQVYEVVTIESRIRTMQ